MGAHPQAENKKQFLRNDSLLVCSMLAIYGVCILGLIGAALWGLDRRNRRVSADATSTAFALATQQVYASATAVARSTEQAQYEFIDRFETSSAVQWSAGVQDSEYWSGYRYIRNGVYDWGVEEVKKNFISWADFDQIHISSPDFDMYVDTKVEEGGIGEVCSGLMFRMSPQGWNGWGYLFKVCNDGFFAVNFDDQKEGWQAVSGRRYSPFIYPSDWNRLQISTRGTHSVFLINGQTVFETDDEWQRSGGVALVFSADKAPARVLFDNFGFQSR